MLLSIFRLSVCVCQLLVHTFCVVHIYLMQRRIVFVCGVFIPCSRGRGWHNAGGFVGSKVIKGSCCMKH